MWSRLVGRLSSLTFHIFNVSGYRWTEFNETLQEARFQGPLPSLCFSGRKTMIAALTSEWRRHFQLLYNHRTGRSQRNLTGSKNTKFVYADRKTKMTTFASDWLKYFWLFCNRWTDFKHDRKQDLNVLYYFCVFRADRKTKMATLASDWLRHFCFYFSATTEQNST